MNKPIAYLTICFAIAVIGFGTWQLFAGNFEAAFAALPFLVVIYLFVLPRQKNNQAD